jgi:hypothetical protein
MFQKIDTLKRFPMIEKNFMNNLSNAAKLNTTDPLSYPRANTRPGRTPTIFPYTIRESYRPNTIILGRGILFRNQSTTRKKIKKMSSVIRKL